MTIKINNEEFNIRDITQLYPAVVVKMADGTTREVSVKWAENAGKDKAEIVGFGIFLHMENEGKHTFMFDTKEEMQEISEQLASQIKQRRAGQ